ncbi:MAG: putative adenylyl-sulfate kinase [Methanosaeta sp. PtaB.Bin039]|nr:MAG: putative adenylyl-sulfate kinase [Methanosaeta sp. PtaB.Bin039]OPY47516.1 MAG: putative adenylyl-sulfate kinase [Methanosaeta sp. PtaU1.Bin028]HOT06863.1 adenylyl-sulfate kinase [Methanotrichaceae archaeon]HQF16759.1 adenylyl-sulfate kinase [Methanotrichaceae archaeon]HQI91391.1 adenylyl-sulfate kinase [Methanotrichaceae archaeon]
MSWVVWFTGLPGCGKTTIAQKTKEILQEMGVEASILQLDEIRRAITPHPRYTEEERDIVYASLAYMAKLLWEHGINVIVDATANRQRYRDLARCMITDFAEIYVQAPLEVCRSRELERRARFSPSGIYKKAENGAPVPGVGAPYEAPLAAEIVLDTIELNPSEAGRTAAQQIVELFPNHA